VRAVVEQVATLAEIALVPQPEIVVPSAVKFTDPVAPLVTVAVNVTEAPDSIGEEDELVNETVDAVPGRTGTRGVERRL
jgi:hypothetical protein